MQLSGLKGKVVSTNFALHFLSFFFLFFFFFFSIVLGRASSVVLVSCTIDLDLGLLSADKHVPAELHSTDSLENR